MSESDKFIRVAWMHRWLEILFAVLVSISLGLSAWTLSTVVTLKEQLAVIQGNRFTSADGLKVWEAIYDIRIKIAQMPSEYPPKWFVARFERLEHKIDQLDQRTQKIVMELNGAKRGIK
jgi:hypothetical protein